jgi:hypothetical protein
LQIPPGSEKFLKVSNRRSLETSLPKDNHNGKDCAEGK